MSTGRQLTEHKVLSPAEELRLARRVRAGDVRAREQLILCNQRLVIWAAQRFKWTQLPFEDLQAMGQAGLIRAVDRFDPELGYKFSTFAGWWVRQSIQRGVAEARGVKPHVVQHLNRIAVLQKEDPNLGFAEACERAGYDPDLYREQRHRLRGDTLSLDLELDEDTEGGTTWLEAMPAEDSTEDEALLAWQAAAVNAALGKLRPQDRRMLEMRYGIGAHDPHNLEEIGRAFGITRERARQRCTYALNEMRTLLNGTLPEALAAARKPGPRAKCTALVFDPVEGAIRCQAPAVGESSRRSGRKNRYCAQHARKLSLEEIRDLAA